MCLPRYPVWLLDTVFPRPFPFSAVMATGDLGMWMALNHSIGTWKFLEATYPQDC